MLTVTDMFCGAGGSSIGAVRVPGIELRTGLNHWKRALETHELNFPDADHDCTDISATDPRRYRRTNILIASPECTNHSLAKGAKRKGLSQYDAFVAISEDPSAERSRATMWDVPRFAEYHVYDIVIVENVVDARTWIMWDAWLMAMHSLGYDHRCVYLNSMFAHPTPQSRDRMYVVFWRRGNRSPDLEISRTGFCHACERNVEAVQSWKNGRTAGRYLRQYLYCCPRCASHVTPYFYCALNAIDLSIPAERIGDKKRRPTERSLDRIRWGLDRFGSTPLCITTRYTSGLDCRVRDVAADALPTQPGDLSHALLTPFLIETAHTMSEGGGAHAGTSPAPTQTTAQTLGVVMPPAWISTMRGTADGQMPSTARGLDEGLSAITAGGRHHMLCINGAALMTMRDAPRFVWAQMQDALHTQVATPQTAIISRQPFLVSYYGTNNGGPVSEAMGALPTKDRHALVEPPQDGRPEVDVDDCYYRMLKDTEIGRGMAFPDSYVVTGNSRERVKQYGNAVTPPAMQLLIERCVASLS